MTTTPLLELRHVTKDFPGIRALSDVSFELLPGEIHALVGENGAGKSTLIKILGGVYPQREFAGDIWLEGRPVGFRNVRDAERQGIAIIHQELMLVEHMTVAENLFLGDEPERLGIVSRKRMRRAAQELLERFGVDIDPLADVAEIGVGKQQLVEIARALRKNSRILILDEPTSALSDQEAEHIFMILKDLRSRGVAIIYISHRLEEVFALADRITVLRDGKTIDTRPATKWTREDVVKAMVGRELKELFPTVDVARGEPVLEVKSLTVEDKERRGAMLLEEISFRLHAGEVLGIAGLMGAGRTELLSTIFGTPPGIVRSGEIVVRGKRVDIGSPHDAIEHAEALVPEDRKNLGLVMDLAVIENLSLAHLQKFCRGPFIDHSAEADACRAMATRMSLREGALTAPVSTLSGGNQQKVVLGRWLMKMPAVLLLDEPTRGIDVGAKAEIYHLINELKAAGTGIIIVSSELPEVLGLSDRILVLRRGRLSAEFARGEATQEAIMERAA